MSKIKKEYTIKLFVTIISCVVINEVKPFIKDIKKLVLLFHNFFTEETERFSRQSSKFRDVAQDDVHLSGLVYAVRRFNLANGFCKRMYGRLVTFMEGQCKATFYNITEAQEELNQWLIDNVNGS